MLAFLLGCDGKERAAPSDTGAGVDTGCVVEERSLDEAIRFDGESDGDQAGGAVAGAGDVDGDGRPDMLVGAPWSSVTGSFAGAVYLVTTGSSPMGLRQATRYTGTGGFQWAGWSVAGAGDLDGDGAADFLFGAMGHEEGGYAAGAALRLRGRDPGGSRRLGGRRGRRRRRRSRRPPDRRAL